MQRRLFSSSGAHSSSWKAQKAKAKKGGKTLTQEPAPIPTAVQAEPTEVELEVDPEEVAAADARVLAGIQFDSTELENLFHASMPVTVVRPNAAKSNSKSNSNAKAKANKEDTEVLVTRHLFCLP